MAAGAAGVARVRRFARFVARKQRRRDEVEVLRAQHAWSARRLGFRHWRKFAAQWHESRHKMAWLRAMIWYGCMRSIFVAWAACSRRVCTRRSPCASTTTGGRHRTLCAAGRIRRGWPTGSGAPSRAAPASTLRSAAAARCRRGGRATGSCEGAPHRPRLCGATRADVLRGSCARGARTWRGAAPRTPPPCAAGVWCGGRRRRGTLERGGASTASTPTRMRTGGGGSSARRCRGGGATRRTMRRSVRTPTGRAASAASAGGVRRRRRAAGGGRRRPPLPSPIGGGALAAVGAWVMEDRAPLATPCTR